MASDQSEPAKRTIIDAIEEAQKLLDETADELGNKKRDWWFMTRITKIKMALADWEVPHE